MEDVNREKNNVVDGYVIPENVEVKEIDVKMWSNGTHAFQDKRSAVWDCATGTVCECGKSYEGKHYTLCPECREKKRDEKYNSLELVEWDKKTPLCLFDGDQYFFSEDDIESYIDDDAIDGDLQLVVCEKVNPPEFDMDEYLIDFTPEDFGVDDLENKKQSHSSRDIEKMVNEYLDSLSPVWYPSNKRVNYA